jgi:hypothetical protein
MQKKRDLPRGGMECDTRRFDKLPLNWAFNG